MQLRPPKKQCGLLLFLTIAGLLTLPKANAASCATQSQMTAAQRNALSNAARSIVNNVQSGDVTALRASTIPAVAADFGGIATSAENLKPLVQHATITVDDLYLLDASSEPANSPQTDFYCGEPVVVLNLTNLPPGKYALTILHATGVPKPQQISLILSETTANHWMLGGFFSRPMTEAGHDGLWYWARAREYAQKKMNWDAWFYYQIAASLLDPVEFLSSPDLAKLQHEADQVRPTGLPGVKPMILEVNGSPFEVATVDATGELGGLDLEVHYIPDAAQLAQLHDPGAAGKQVIDIMRTLLALHPELRAAFRGLWVRADEGNFSVFALDLPMKQIDAGTQPTTKGSSPAAR